MPAFHFNIGQRSDSKTFSQQYDLPSYKNNSKPFDGTSNSLLTYENPSLGIKMQYPHDWERSERPISGRQR